MDADVTRRREKKLLRLKCEAYSTLNEADEDPEAEVRLQNRMGQAGGLSPPKASLVAPASLYLTAILECVAVALLLLCCRSQVPCCVPCRAICEYVLE